LTYRLVAQLSYVDGVELLGDPDYRVPHIVCLFFAGV
jgi:hypothetical protein